MLNWIKLGINKGIDDSDKIRRALYKWLGRPNGQRVQSFVPFGTFGNPSAGTVSLLLSINGKESNIVALEGDSFNRVKKDCKPGEYGIGNPLTKANIYFKEDGNVILELPKGIFKVDSTEGAVDINASKNITIDGQEVNMNSGTNGVARLGDEVQSTSADDSVFWTWINASATVLAGLGVASPIPTSLSSKITSSSSTVKAGD